MDQQASTGRSGPVGLNHLVLNVRDIEESHRFWTEVLGFKHVGTLRPAPGRPPGAKMRFYSMANRPGGISHHDLALVENATLPAPPAQWAMHGMPMAINHIALCWPTREAWLQQLEYMQEQGIAFHRRIEHGMTHSVYISDPNGYGVEVLYELPREVWEGNMDDALNYSVSLPTEGKEALQDRHQDVPVFGR